MRLIRAVIFSFALIIPAFAEVQILEEMIFHRMCSASAGIALNTNLLVVADDESNLLRTYSRSRPALPVHQLDIGTFLQVGKGKPEVDAEGAAQIGDTVYWITSHGRNREGEIRPSRQRFFATRINRAGEPRLELAGRPYANLLRDLVAAPQLAQFDLADAAGKAPKKKGALNIEGLAAGPDDSLLIAFRNPVPDKKALLVPLLNPAELVQSQNARARFGPAIQLDLRGNGVRDIVRIDGQYYIIAGARDGGHDLQLYRWNGNPPQSAPELLHEWQARTFNPEAILAIPERPAEFIILSDDGSVKQGGEECNNSPEGTRRFRGILLKIQ